MAEHGHCRTQACVAVARKLVERTWTVLSRGIPYRIRDLDGQPISQLEAKKMIKQVCTVLTRSGRRLGRTAQPRIEPS